MPKGGDVYCISWSELPPKTLHGVTWKVPMLTLCIYFLQHGLNIYPTTIDAQPCGTASGASNLVMSLPGWIL